VRNVRKRSRRAAGDAAADGVQADGTVPPPGGTPGARLAAPSLAASTVATSREGTDDPVAVSAARTELDEEHE
jgi:hypothetical protein